MPREYSAAAILLVLFMVLISLVPVLNLLYFHISTFRSMFAVSNMAVFCSSLTLLLLLFTIIEFSSVTIVLTQLQTKQIRINMHKRNNTKTQYTQYKTQ